MTEPPPFPGAPGAPGVARTFTCPKCQGQMRTYNRNGVHVEQCDSCRGLFLDFGEFEHLTQLETRYNQPPPPSGPAWGSYQQHKYRKKGFSGLFFSS